MHKDMSKAADLEVEDSTFISPVCGKIFVEISILETHQEEHKRKPCEEIADLPEFECDLCDFKSTNSKTTEDHASNMHGVINCERCQY